MKNPFEEAKKLLKYLKILVYGDSGIGKTYFSLGFPSPAVIDTESGTNFYSDDFKFSVLRTNGFKDTLDAVCFLETRKHNYKTVIIDSITVISEALQEGRMYFKESQNKGEIGENVDFNGLDWAQMKRFYKILMNKLMNLPMHVILVSREKEKYAHGKEMKIIGHMPDCDKSTRYIVDLRFRLTSIGGNRTAIIEKDRTKHYKEGDTIIDPSWDVFKDFVAEGSGNVLTSNIDNKKDGDLFDQKEEKKKPPKKEKSPIERFRSALPEFLKIGIESAHLLKYLNKTDFDVITEDDIKRINNLWLDIKNGVKNIGDIIK